MKILHLTIKKKWFDLIADGKKIIEYREDKPHWVVRLTRFTYRQPIIFDEIHFKNGYLADSPFMRTSHRGTTSCHSSTCYPTNGEELDGNYFLILLGEVLEVKR